MGSQNLKGAAVKGVFWKFAERIFAQGVSFVVTLVLARLLMPEDYGVISILMIFIGLANVFVSDGFSSALIQKKNVDSLDYSSVLIGSFSISLILYAIIFFGAPALADFYGMPLLCATLRVLALRLLLAAINSVELAYLSKNMQFKKFFWATFFGTAISAVVGIYMAYAGFGAWALVAQNLVNYSIDTVVLAVLIGKIPPLRFSFSRLKELLKYGYKILLTSLMFSITDKIRSLIIGKIHSAQDLAFYSKGKQFPMMISTNISGPLSNVLFPVMSKVQSDTAAVKKIMRRSVRTITFIVPALLLGFASVSEQFVKLILTDKWLPCVPFIWIGCVYYFLVSIHSVNLEAVKAVGRSDQVLKYGLYKRIAGFVTLIVSLPFGVIGISLSLVASAVLATIINAYQNKKLFRYGYWEQLMDIMPNILCAVAMSVIVVIAGKVTALSVAAVTVIKIISGILAYLVITYIFRKDDFYSCLEFIKQLTNKKRR